LLVVFLFAHGQGGYHVAQNKPAELKRWDPRPWPSSGDTSDEMVYAWVGRALSAWERHEAKLGVLFASFLVQKEANALPAIRPYFSVRTFEGRAEMLRAASAAYFSENPNEPLQGEFKSLISEAIAFSPRRNEIAHGIVVKFGRTPDERARPGDTFGLEPTFATFRQRNLENDAIYCYCSRELRYFRDEFNILADAAEKFSDALP
jgi:hypothetical protein